MVNPVGSSVSTYPTSQPSFSSGVERAVPEQVQPRQAPAAESQRGDQRLGNREDDTRRTEERAVANASARRSESSSDSNRRGGTLDVVV